ncbi:MAG: DUF1045 domain-containing protein [Alphaproteobacteria bacterium]|nr:DUF1045 domain-containing protein [Beijerinckiaceae bacterium]NBQ39164.1 DUF1045 domain-containing protein [Alphaproteobacteria bacterium]
MSGNDAARYAIYYAPEPSTKLWQFGSSVVGYDAVDGTDQAVPAFADSLSGRWHELTSEPRKYGFHATLKAPFHLAQGVDEMALMVAIERFSQTARAAIMEGLEVASIGPFIALRPFGDVAILNALASTIVRHFEPFRAPLSAEDRARRLKSPLTERQTDYLDRFGYPYVHEEFRFHMTLTGPLHADDREATLSVLKSAYQQYGGATQTTIDRICLFKQDTPSSRFRIIGSAILA